MTPDEATQGHSTHSERTVAAAHAHDALRYGRPDVALSAAADGVVLAVDAASRPRVSELVNLLVAGTFAGHDCTDLFRACVDHPQMKRELRAELEVRLPHYDAITPLTAVDAARVEAITNGDWTLAVVRGARFPHEAVLLKVAGLGLSPKSTGIEAKVRADALMQLVEIERERSRGPGSGKLLRDGTEEPAPPARDERLEGDHARGARGYLALAAAAYRDAGDLVGATYALARYNRIPDPDLAQTQDDAHRASSR